MLVPKAPMDKDDDLMLGKNNVRNSGQIATMEPEPKAQSVQLPADTEFGHSVPLPDSAHHSAAGF